MPPSVKDPVVKVDRPQRNSMCGQLGGLACANASAHARCYTCYPKGGQTGLQWTTHCFRCGGELPADTRPNVPFCETVYGDISRITATGVISILPSRAAPPTSLSLPSGLYCRRCDVEAALRTVTSAKLHYPCGTPLVGKAEAGKPLTTKWLPPWSDGVPVLHPDTHVRTSLWQKVITTSTSMHFDVFCEDCKGRIRIPWLKSGAPARQTILEHLEGCSP